LDGLGRFNEEITSYDKALSIDPNNKNAINNKAAVLNILLCYVLNMLENIHYVNYIV
jgi:tetratricopeptide (TPR) repeat protein